MKVQLNVDQLHVFSYSIYFLTTKILHQGLNDNFKAGKNKRQLQDLAVMYINIKKQHKASNAIDMKDK